MDASLFDDAREGLRSMADGYRAVERLNPPPRAEELMAQLAPSAAAMTR